MGDILCIQCKFIGTPGRVKRGNYHVERIGWMLFPLGVPYTLWRMFSKKPVCRQCGSEMVVPADSIAGLRMTKIVAGESMVKRAAVVPAQEPVEAPTEIKAEPKLEEKAEVNVQKPKKPVDPNVW